MGAAITVLRRLLQLCPRQPRALYALGQMHALLRDWRASEMHYLDSANAETVCGLGRGARTCLGDYEHTGTCFLWRC